MRSITLFFVFAVILLMLSYAVLEFRSYAVLRNILNKYEESTLSSKKTNSKLSQNRKPDTIRSVRVEFKEALDRAIIASQVTLGKARGNSHLAGLYRKVAEYAQDEGEGVRFYCKALSEYGKAIQKEPLQSRLLINWANLRQVLGGFDCEERYTRGDYKSALDKAVQFNPSDMNVKYSAALIFEWAGKKDEARKLYQDALTFGTNLETRHEHYIFSKITDTETLKAILLPRFPQVNMFLEYHFSAPRRFAERPSSPEFKLALADIEYKAIEGSISEYEEGKVPFKVHFNRLITLLAYVENSLVRQRLDGEIALLSIRQDKTQLAKYFDERRQYRELEIVRSVSQSDTRPLKSPLLVWGRNDVVFFDEFYKTLGFYLAEGQSPRVIQLYSQTKAKLLSPSEVRVYVSTNNDSWSEFGEGIKVENFDFGEGSMVVLRVPPLNYKYWKVHFANPEREKTFVNSTEALLKVFGLSTRELITRKR